MKRTVQIIILSLALVHLLNAQSILEGFIKNGQGDVIPYATLMVKGTSDYAIADSNGYFNLVTKAIFPFNIEINSVGYVPKETEISKRQDTPLLIVMVQDNLLTEVIVSARRRNESVHEVPISISVIRGEFIDNSGAFNVNRLKEIVPTVQLYSSNPRNTTLNIRGMGSTFGLTNDGIDPGVGFYIDGVYIARPAVTQLDFIDVEQVEVLRGPQGTLFGKNTTAGAFNITTKKPSHISGAGFEVSYGNYGYVQAKSSVTGPLIKKILAGRISFSGSQRDGTVYNVAKDEYVNDLNNLGFRGQLLFTPVDNWKITLQGDLSRQRPNGYAQVMAGVAPTLRPDFRQFNNIIADLNYSLPSENPFDRKIDHDTPWRSLNDLGGIALNVEAGIGRGTLTSTTAWRFWDWGPSNDRDFTGLPVLNLSQATSRHVNWSQEIRYAGEFFPRLSGVVGVFLIDQDLKSDPYHIQESGSAQWRFSQNNTDPLWQTPGLLEGYGIRTTNRLQSFSAAVFGNLDWAITERIHLLPGFRYNNDVKEVYYLRETYGGLDTDDPDLLSLKYRVYSNQFFESKVNNSNLTGQITMSYHASDKVNAYATYSTNYKPVGINLGGLPTDQGKVLIELAQVRPEYVNHVEVGVKTIPIRKSTLTMTLYNTEIKDYQTVVQTAELGVNRGYLANADRVRVTGAEADANFEFENFKFFGALVYTAGQYISFKNAPVPLEETGGEQAFKDISGGILPGISRWAGSAGFEVFKPSRFLGLDSKFFIAADTYCRSSFSSSPSPSKYLTIGGYTLLNSRVGFRTSTGLSFWLWIRNLTNKDYFEQLLPAGGNAGHYAGVLGDPRTFGVTLRFVL